MALFTFSSCIFNGTTIAAGDTVYGTGIFEESGWDTENNTADGLNRRDRITKRGRGRITCYGNQIAVCHPASAPIMSATISMLSTDGTDVTRTGSVTLGVFDDGKQNTVINFVTDPIPPSS